MKRPHHEEENGEAWLLPYSDLMTLLLAVFIVLFAASQIDAEKARQITEEFSEKMMKQSYTESIRENQRNENSESNNTADSELQKMEALKAELDAKFKSENLTDYVTTKIDQRGLVISLSNAILFDSGRAEIKTEYEDTLLKSWKTSG